MGLAIGLGIHKSTPLKESSFWLLGITRLKARHVGTEIEKEC